ncbi:MAG: HDOD domain-containing protein [bacterium]
MNPPDNPLLDDADEPGSARDPQAVLRVVERLLDGSGDPESDLFLREVTSEVARHTGSMQVVLSLVDAASGSFEARATHGFAGEAPADLSWLENGVHGWVHRTGTPLILTEPEAAGGLPLLSFEVPPLVAAPIRVGDSTLGVVAALRPLRQEGYAEDDLLFLQTIGALLGGMIGHRRAEAQGRDAIRKTIESLTMALDARDAYTRGHSQRVAMYSVAITNELERDNRWSFVKERRNSLLMSALLHDIGKIGIRDEILLKPGKLTDEEYALIKAHTTKGAEIVRGIPGFDEDVIAGILQHHEKWDGKGYPAGLSGEQIHIFGRIIGLADAFDAIVTSRPYHSGASFQYAMGRVEELSGTAFDPEVVRAMMRAFKDSAVWNDLGNISLGGPKSEEAPPAEGEPVSTDRALRKIFGRSINELPTLPHVVSQILEKTRNQSTRLDELVDIISTDQVLVSTFLKLVNSAFYGFSRRITTLKQAITLLGFRSVRNVVVNAGVVGIFRKRTFSNRYRLRLWDHSVSCAVCARVLAERSGYLAREEAFTGGLLHDIGKIVIDQYAPRQSRAIMARVDAGEEARLVEAEVLGADHMKIGVWIADRWHLPKALCAAIECHHDPDSAQAAPDRELVRIVASANGLAKIRRTERPEELDAALEAYVASPANLLKLDLGAAREVVAATWQGKAEAMRTFGGLPSEMAEPAADDEGAARKTK